MRAFFADAILDAVQFKLKYNNLWMQKGKLVTSFSFFISYTCLPAYLALYLYF